MLVWSLWVKITEIHPNIGKSKVGMIGSYNWKPILSYITTS